MNIREILLLLIAALLITAALYSLSFFQIFFPLVGLLLIWMMLKLMVEEYHEPAPSEIYYTPYACEVSGLEESLRSDGYEIIAADWNRYLRLFMIVARRANL